MKLSRRKFMEALAAAGIISVAPPLKASPTQPPPPPPAPPAPSPSTKRYAWVDEGSFSFSISPSHSTSVSASPEWMGHIEDTTDDLADEEEEEEDGQDWPEPYGGSVPLKLDIEEARKAVEAMEKLGGLMGESADDFLRRVFKDVLK